MGGADKSPSLKRQNTYSLAGLCKARPLSRSKSTFARATAANPKYYLQHFSNNEKRYWWRLTAQKSSDVRVRLYLFFEEPSSPLAIGSSVAIVAFVILMQVMHVASTHVEHNSQLDRVLFVGQSLCNAVFTLEFVLRMVGIAAPVQVRSRAVLAEQVTWLVGDAMAIGAFWIHAVLRGEHIEGADNAAQWLDLCGALRIGRIYHGLYRWPDGALLVNTLLSSAKALTISFSFLAVCAFFFGALIFYVERLSLGAEAAAFEDMTLAIWFMLVTFSTVRPGAASSSTPHSSAPRL